MDTLFGYTGRDWDADVGLQYNRARWYDPAQGRWLSQDPIGFDAGDANLYRYVGNQSTFSTDPSGMEAVLVIYIETEGLPSNFNLNKVRANFAKILNNAGASASILVITTDRPVPSSERGWMDDDTSYFWASGWWNLYPLTWFTSSLHDLYMEIGDACTNAEKFYVHSVRFVSPKRGGNIANTSGTLTKINVVGLNSKAAGKSKIDWNMLYANILMHEAVYLGLLGRYDDPRAPKGTFPSAAALPNSLMKLTSKEKDAIDAALFCEENDEETEDQ